MKYLQCKKLQDIFFLLWGVNSLLFNYNYNNFQNKYNFYISVL